METSIPVNIRAVVEEIKPKTFKQEKTTDQKIAKLAGGEGWETLKARIENRIEGVKSLGTYQGEDMALHGFKRMAIDLMIEAYQAVIDDVEVTAKFLKEEEKNDAK
jgi:hypothetical protein